MDEGDQQLTGDDNASPAQSLSTMFPFYGTSYSTLYVSCMHGGSLVLCEYELTNPHILMQVSTNGLLSFNRRYTSSSPRLFPLVEEVLISPFWADININVQGRIFYRFSSITSSIHYKLDLYIADSSFSPSSVFIATWDGVAEYNSDGRDVSIIITREYPWKFHGLVNLLCSFGS